MKNERISLKHYSRTYEHPKIEKMVSELGWNGYGLYWALLELMFYAPSVYEGSVSYDYDYLSLALDTAPKILKRLVEEFDLFFIEQRIYENELKLEN